MSDSTRKDLLPPNYPGAVLIGEAEIEAVVDVLQARSPFRYYGIDMKNYVRRLEDRIAEYMDVPFALGVSSCTAALIVALKALGIGYGDKVIVPAVSFIATAGAVICANAVPVFVDVDDSLNLSASDLERVYDSEVKAVITVPVLGHPVNIDPVIAFARSHGIAVIEDVAQSCGTTLNGKQSGTYGDIGVFSFQMNKLLTAGEGGAVITRSPELFERAVRYHDQGLFRDKLRYNRIEFEDERYAFAGQNYRMSELTGAVLLKQWDRLDGMLSAMRKRKREIVEALQQHGVNITIRGGVDDDGDAGSSLGLICRDADSAQRMLQQLLRDGIAAFLLYNGVPLYKFPQIRHQRTAEANGFPFQYPFRTPVDYEQTECPNAERLLAATVFIPISPVMTAGQADAITASIIRATASSR